LPERPKEPPHELDLLISEDFLSDTGKDDQVLTMLDDHSIQLTQIIKNYWDDLQDSIQTFPIMKVYLASIYKMAHEYTRIEEHITAASEDLENLGLDPLLTNERARLRDNMSAMTTEGWKLLNALLDSLHKMQTLIKKLTEKSGEGDDPMERFLSGGVE